MDCLDHLDAEFLVTLKRIQRCYTSLPKLLQVRVETWCGALAEESIGQAWRRTRNQYATLLLQAVQEGRLDDPFHQAPPAGPLPQLPSHVVLRLRRPSAAPATAPSEPRRAWDNILATFSAHRLVNAGIVVAPLSNRRSSSVGTNARNPVDASATDGSVARHKQVNAMDSKDDVQSGLSAAFVNVKVNSATAALNEAQPPTFSSPLIDVEHIKAQLDAERSARAAAQLECDKLRSDYEQLKAGCDFLRKENDSLQQQMLELRLTCDKEIASVIEAKERQLAELKAVHAQQLSDIEWRKALQVERPPLHHVLSETPALNNAASPSTYESFHTSLTPVNRARRRGLKTREDASPVVIHQSSEYPSPSARLALKNSRDDVLLTRGRPVNSARGAAVATDVTPQRNSVAVSESMRDARTALHGTAFSFAVSPVTPLSAMASPCKPPSSVATGTDPLSSVTDRRVTSSRQIPSDDDSDSDFQALSLSFIAASDGFQTHDKLQQGAAAGAAGDRGQPAAGASVDVIKGAHRHDSELQASSSSGDDSDASDDQDSRDWAGQLL